MRNAAVAAALAVILSALACGPPAEEAPPAESRATTAPVATAVPKPTAHPQIDGRAFPDHVVALTWDDGPDQHTLDLADYLASRHVSATFFVVGEWAESLSEEPGRGAHEYETGYTYIPILADLVALGHRLGNHTENHVLLTHTKRELVDFELRENQRGIDPFLINELRVFRSPGGAWDDDAGAVLDDDPALAGLVGPIRWDIDRKDWEGSLYCRSERPKDDCEPAGSGRRRVRADVTARRYIDSVDAAGHGIVLFHDRVGEVGSDYALRVAKRVVPALEARGYVFSAPVLAFSPFRPRIQDSLTLDWLASLDTSTITFVDVDGDGRADLCGRGSGGFGCARSFEVATRAGVPETRFEWREAWHASLPLAPPRAAGTALVGDLNGDGRLDECARTGAGLACALRGPHGLLGSSVWAPIAGADSAAWQEGRLVLADVNGDGRADLCSVTAAAALCALAP
jgi:peptidoglycan/xylan/chitin deacetylase (PgdA/CDA1 family)